ncbi:MAG TPA: hypothetical protein VMX17_06650 [Candidatus Glassbacteria bacterium]|nr:hypothetical protein [Candidatus Glassbacteria bacterium]
MKGIAVTECRTCPHKNSTNHWSSDGWDRMEDWECGLLPGDGKEHKNKKIRGAVEWHEESKIGQPDWCPLPNIESGWKDVPPLRDQEGNIISDRNEMGS